MEGGSSSQQSSRSAASLLRHMATCGLASQLSTASQAVSGGCEAGAAVVVGGWEAGALAAGWGVMGGLQQAQTFGSSLEGAAAMAGWGAKGALRSRSLRPWALGTSPEPRSALDVGLGHLGSLGRLEQLWLQGCATLTDATLAQPLPGSLQVRLRRWTPCSLLPKLDMFFFFVAMR